MKTTLFQKSVNLGFTLIELLIVIALLGVLAVGLLATIDPFEQLKKGRDTSVRNIVEEFYNASLRYYSTKDRLPWTDPTDWPSSDPLAEFKDTYISDLASAGELKSDFYDLATSDRLAKVLLTGDSESLAVCFRGESKSFQIDPNTKFTATGSLQNPGYCKSDEGTNDCYWCIK